MHERWTRMQRKNCAPEPHISDQSLPCANVTLTLRQHLIKCPLCAPERVLVFRSKRECTMNLILTRIHFIDCAPEEHIRIPIFRSNEVCLS